MIEKLLQAFGIDGPAAREDDALLLLEKFVVIGSRFLFLNHLALENMLFDDLRHQFRLDEVVGDGLFAGNNDVHKYVVGAQAPAPRPDNGAALADLALDPMLFEFLAESICHRLGAGCEPACPLADKDSYLFGIRGHLNSPLTLGC